MFGLPSTSSHLRFALPLLNPNQQAGNGGFGAVLKPHQGAKQLKNRKRSFEGIQDRPRKTRRTLEKPLGGQELPALRGPSPLDSLRTRDPVFHKPFAHTEGLHPELFAAKKENAQLTKRLNKVEEQKCFWRRKSLTLQGELSQCQKEVSELRKKVDRLEGERLQLQAKLMEAERSSSKCMESIQALLSENEDLKGVAADVNEELRILTSEGEPKTDSAMGDAVMQDAVHMAELEQALADTLADLSDKIEEIDVLKAALVRVSVEKHNLDEVVTKEMLLKEMITLNDNDDHKDPEANPELVKIVRLQEAVDKCMFRIALLGQKNEELKRQNGLPGAGRPGAFSPTLLETLEDGQKVTVLESMCMQRYRKLLRNAAQSLVGQDLPDDRMDESF